MMKHYSLSSFLFLLLLRRGNLRKESCLLFCLLVGGCTPTPQGKCAGCISQPEEQKAGLIWFSPFSFLLGGKTKAESLGVGQFGSLFC